MKRHTFCRIRIWLAWFLQAGWQDMSFRQAWRLHHRASHVSREQQDYQERMGHASDYR